VVPLTEEDGKWEVWSLLSPACLVGVPALTLQHAEYHLGNLPVSKIVVGCSVV